MIPGVISRKKRDLAIWHPACAKLLPVSFPSVKILIVEDEERLSRELQRALGEAGYAVDCAADGERAEFLGQTERYDAVVLDLGLPQDRRPDAACDDGATAGLSVPVLMLTARGSWHEKVQGIDSGADDYVAKPFAMEEVLARLRALIRRASGQVESGAAVRRAGARPTRRQGDGRRRARQADEPRVPRAVVPDASSAAASCRRPSSPSTSTRRTPTATRTRSKCSSRGCAASSARSFIETVRGLGYRIGGGFVSSLRSRVIGGSVLWTIGIVVVVILTGAMFAHRFPTWVSLLHRSMLTVVALILIAAGLNQLRRGLLPLKQLRGAAARRARGYGAPARRRLPDGSSAARRRPQRAARSIASCGSRRPRPRPAISRTD